MKPKRVRSSLQAWEVNVHALSNQKGAGVVMLRLSGKSKTTRDTIH